MKNLKLIILLLLSAFSTLTFAAVNGGSTGLYISDSFKALPIENTTKILEKFEQQNPDKNIVIFIHGRGKDVKEQWQSITQLERDYGVRVIMFSWPSWASLTVRPVANAQNAANDLGEMFSEIKKYKEEYPEILMHKKISLLSHSMGNIVFKEYVEKYYQQNLNDYRGRPLFDTLISSAADVDIMDHREWFSKIDFFKSKNVAMNSSDMTLNLSRVLDVKNGDRLFYRLGLGFRPFIDKPERIPAMLDSKTTYLDLSRSLKSEHRYFDTDKPNLLRLYHALLNGDVFDPIAQKLKTYQDESVNYIMD